MARHDTATAIAPPSRGIRFTVPPPPSGGARAERAVVPAALFANTHACGGWCWLELLKLGPQADESPLTAAVGCVATRAKWFGTVL